MHRPDRERIAGEASAAGSLDLAALPGGSAATAGARRRSWRRALGRSAGVWLALFLVCLGQMALLGLLLRPRGLHPGYLSGVGANATTLLAFLAAAMAVRFLLRLASTRAPGAALRELGEGRRLLDLAWVLVVMVTLIEAYSWTKVMIPALNPRLFDRQLAALDEILFLGHNPNVFLLALLRSAPFGLGHGVEWYYEQFIRTMPAFAAWFLTAPKPAERVGFAAGLIATWLIGVWVYVACPSLGPAYVYSDLWHEVRDAFPLFAAAQAELMANYQNVLRILHGEVLMIRPMLGIAAMPSLHVAIHALYFYWAVKLRSPLRGVLLLSTLAMFVGSIASAWHYAVDSLAALLLAAVGLAIAWRVRRYVERGDGSLAAVGAGSRSSRAAAQ